MNLELPSHLVQPAAEALAAAGCSDVAESIQQRVSRFGLLNGLSVDVAALGESGLDVLHALAKQEGERGLMTLISSFRKVVASPFEAKVGNLKTLPAGLVAFIVKDCIDGWLYAQDGDGAFVPWLVRDVKFYPPTQNCPAHVILRMSANTAKASSRQSRNESTFNSVSFDADDVAKRTIPEILAAEGLYHETPELKAAYEKDLEDFRAYRPQYGAQFLGSGVGLVEEGYRKRLVGLAAGARLVNDEELTQRVLIDQVDAAFWEGQKGAPVFCQQPYHCRLYMYHLGVHENVWVHVSALRPYAYQPELREKLILPETHRDLIDILTTDMDVVMGDIIDGKSGGTTILCKGSPGLGKTLTAEVYAEVVQKPLYRVHSGQLGTDAESVEAALKDILQRAARWGAVLLLDEADVFVRKRDNDIQHNAVVAAFLRTLEYFNGLLFMTTNRADDIDDAILSRCIAVVKYELPTPDNAKRIWRVLADQMEVALSDALIDELADRFPDASGRDIKELLKLTSKFARRKELPLSYDLFRQCAMFRGIV